MKYEISKLISVSILIGNPPYDLFSFGFHHPWLNLTSDFKAQIFQTFLNFQNIKEVVIFDV